MTVVIEVPQSDKDFVLDTLRRSRRWLTASQIAHYSRDRKSGEQVWCIMDVLVANPDGEVCRAIHKGLYVYQTVDKMDALPKTATLLTVRKAIVASPDAREQPAPDKRPGLYRLPFYHPIMQ